MGRQGRYTSQFDALPVAVCRSAGTGCTNVLVLQDRNPDASCSLASTWGKLTSSCIMGGGVREDRLAGSVWVGR